MKIHPKFSYGWTLIEILIVMLIISIVGAAATIMVQKNHKSEIQNLAKEIVNTLQLAQQQAIITSTDIGFAFTENSLQYFHYSINSKSWQAYTDKALGLHHFDNNIKITLYTSDKKISSYNQIQTVKPFLIISSSGDTTPFTLELGNGDTPQYRIQGKSNGSISHGFIQ
jgi:general secretion pathway protein H